MGISEDIATSPARDIEEPFEEDVLGLDNTSVAQTDEEDGEELFGNNMEK